MSRTVSIAPAPFGPGWHAWLDGDRRLWGCGRDVREAIADVLRTHAGVRDGSVAAEAARGPFVLQLAALPAAEEPKQ